jgi:ABC-2 type transport system ATP-binding protein
MTCAIETIGLTKMFGVTRGIEGLDLRVEPGEIFGFLGPNGAGKTTTIRALLDLQRPTAGTAVVLGLDAHRDSVAIHARVGYLPGDLALFSRMTAGDHFAWFVRARGLTNPGSAGALAARFDVPLDRRVKELSRGNRPETQVDSILSLPGIARSEGSSRARAFSENLNENKNSRNRGTAWHLVATAGRQATH